MEADGCIRVPNDLAYAVEKTRKPIKKEKSSGRAECEYLHNFAELWEPWGADLLRPVVLFWKIPLPPWVWNLQPGGAVEEAWEEGCRFVCLF